MEIYNDKAKFVIFGTGDNWDRSKDEWAGELYNLKRFIKLYLKNDINLLKEVFLNKNVVFEKNGLYEYRRMAENNMNRYGDYPGFIMQRKNFDEICKALTTIYKRLYVELKDNRKEVLDKFAIIMTSLGVANCEFAIYNCEEFLPTAKYIEQFVNNKAIKNDVHKQVVQDYLYKNVYEKLMECAKDRFKYNQDRDELANQLVGKIIDQDVLWLKNKEQNKQEIYTNNDELPVEEQRKRFCDRYAEMTK